MFLLYWIRWIDQFLLLNLPINPPSYILIVYKVIKYILHLVTGMSQIYRLCTSINLVKDGAPTGRLVFYVKRTLDLSERLDPDASVEDTLGKIRKSKGIVTPSMTKMIEKCLIKIKAVDQVKLSIKEMKDRKYVASKDEHLLQEIWTGLKQFKDAPPVPSLKWSDIGFQGKDPSTDFRGMGYLGLYQLHSFVTEETDLALVIHETSNCETKWFPMAIVGINITAFLYGLLSSHQLDIYLYSLPVSPETALNKIYAEIFQTFHKDWKNSDAIDIMDFPRIFSTTKHKLTLKYTSP